MMNKTIFSRFNIMTVGVIIVLAAIISIGSIAYASHSWGGYHWARTTSSFTLKLGDNVSSAWDAYLVTASTDWTVSNVLDTSIVLGVTNPKVCRATNGRVEVCNANYGNNGWLGVASIWISGSHITKGTVKLNDSYFNTVKYNTTAWKNLVMCQEIGHTFGLAHQDENFSNPNLGTCMDYTNDPTSNQHPNQHDYDMLGTIYSHLDGITTIGATVVSKGNHADINTDDSSGWGKAIKKDSKGKTSLYERDLGNGNKIFTFVTWVE